MGSDPPIEVREPPLSSPRPAPSPPTLSLAPRASASPSKRPQASQEPDYSDPCFGVTEFGQGGLYLRNKRAKLQHQAAIDDQGRPQIFLGLSIYINGLTLPLTLPQLSQTISLHGGVYCPYLDKKSLATHIVASQLTPSKAEEFKKSKSKVALPAWITDSVAQGRLLDWRQYSLFAAKEKTDVEQEGFTEGLFSYDDGAARLGTQCAQRNILGMFGTGAQRAGGSASARSTVKSSTVKKDTLPEQGKRLGNVVVQQQGLLKVQKRLKDPILLPPKPQPATLPFGRQPKSPPIKSNPLPPSRVPKSSQAKSGSSAAAPPSPPESPARRRPQPSDAVKQEEVPSSSAPQITQPPPNQRALKKEISVLVLSDSDDDEAVPQKAEPAKRQGANASSKVQIEVKKSVSPKSPKPKQRKLGLSSSKSTLQIQASKSKAKSEDTAPSSVSDAPPSPPADRSRSSTPTDQEVLSLGFDLEVFRCLSAKEQRQQLKERQDEMEKIKRLTVNAPRRQPRSADTGMREVEVVKLPRLKGQTETKDVCRVIEEWVMDGVEQAPDNEDAERVQKWFRKCAEGQLRDVPKAVEVLRWWEMVLVDQFGKREAVQEKVGTAWWDTLDSTRRMVDEAARKICGGGLVDL